MLELIKIKKRLQRNKVKLLRDLRDFYRMQAQSLKPDPPIPYMTMFRRQYGRWPDLEELKAFINLYILPSCAYKFQGGEIRLDLRKTEKIQRLQREQLELLIQQNDRKNKV